MKKVQTGYRAQPLSQFLPAPPAGPTIDFIKPLTPDQERSLSEFFNSLNFVLEFCPKNQSEKELMARFAKLNIGAGKNFDVAKLSSEVRRPSRTAWPMRGRPSRRQKSKWMQGVGVGI